MAVLHISRHCTYPECREDSLYSYSSAEDLREANKRYASRPYKCARHNGTGPIASENSGGRMASFEEQMQPSAEYAKLITLACASYKENVTTLALYVFSLGVIQGQVQGQRFGRDMIDSLREDGVFE
jgi:hypothetical protein